LVEAETETRRQEERKAKEERLKSKELLATYHSEIECLAQEKAREEARGRALREEATRAGEPFFCVQFETGIRLVSVAALCVGSHLHCRK
jgi:hypothetical protein